MHRELLKLLHEAEGQSARVVVVFLDVRGFSSFAGIAESTDTAEFLKTVYLKIIDEFFPDTLFFKPTGDGLLILLDYNRDNLQEVVQFAVTKSIKLVEDFPSFCQTDPMINFQVPKQLGVGLARGSATSLTTDGKLLDFSGRPLNLASRLMDLARPSGVVFDADFGFELLEADTKARFKDETVFVKGLAESKPMDVFCLDGYVEIPEYSQHPLDGFERYSEPEEKLIFKALERRDRFRHPLTKEPARTDNMEAHLRYPKVLKDGRKAAGMSQFATLPAKFKSAAGQSYALVDYRSKVAELRARGIKSNWQITVTIEYSVLPEDDSNPGSA